MALQGTDASVLRPLAHQLCLHQPSGTGLTGRATPLFPLQRSMLDVIAVSLNANTPDCKTKGIVQADADLCCTCRLRYTSCTARRMAGTHCSACASSGPVSSPPIS